MPLLDMNMNMNMALPSAVGAFSRLRPRYNSDLESLLVDTTAPNTKLVPPVGAPQNYPSFHPYWDAELQSYMYLADYLAKVASWRADCTNAATGAGKPSKDMTQAELGGEVLQILQFALERDDRFDEVIDQDDADGAINYWLGMLKIDPARHPGTYLMVHTARRIGEHVVMCLKGDFHSPRPSQLCPAITPMIDPPATPTFPAGHAVQSYLISYLLAYSLADAAGNTNLPQHKLPAPTSTLAQFLAAATAPTGALFDLAGRVSQNRIVAGVHFPTDIAAGQAVAIQIFLGLQNTIVWTTGGAPPQTWLPCLRDAVRVEFPQYAK
jgi:membrane-associated phospholipid phosphatase